MYITKSEKKVLELIYLTNKQIAKILFIDATTVKSHIHNLLKKYKAQTRTELFIKAVKNNDIDLVKIMEAQNEF